MALVKCKECGNMISKKAKSCPSCGAPVKARSGCGSLLALGVIIFIVIMVVVAVTTDDTPTPSAKPSPKLATSPSQPPKPSASRPAPQPKPVADRLTEPDWQARLAELKKRFLPEFRQKHAVGNPIDLKLAQGNNMSGVLKEVTADAVVITLQHGEATFQRNQIHPYMRGDFFAEDFALLEAKEKIRAERGEYLARVAEEKRKIQEQKDREKAKEALVDEWLQAIVNSVDGFDRVSLAGDRETLTITVSDAWYYTPDFQKERIMEETGKQFALFASGMGWRGDKPDAANYPTVKFIDVAGKDVGKHSTWGTKVIR